MRILIVLIAVLFAGTAHAEVDHVGPGGFSSTYVHELPLPPEEAWILLTQRLPDWWDADHSYSGKPENLSLTVKPGGCLCETLDDGGWVEHLRVTFIMPGKQLRLEGALGPLADMGLHGTMSFSLEPMEGGTRLTARYLVQGQLEGGFEGLAPIVDGVNGGHFVRLARVAAGQPAEG